MFCQHLGNLKRVEFKINQLIYGENFKKDRTQHVRLPFAVFIQVLDERHQRAEQEDQNLWGYARKSVQANSKVSERESSVKASVIVIITALKRNILFYPCETGQGPWELASGH